MARIAREEHAAIRRRVDVDGEKVTDVAAAYGCTPANIYGILSKLRRLDGPAASAPALLDARPETASSPATAATVPADLFEGPRAQSPSTAPVTVASPPLAKPIGTKAGKAASQGTGPVASPAYPSVSTDSRPDRGAAAPKAAAPQPKAQIRKPGYALLMRSSDGEETANPFRSLDELLSAAKPILRTAALSLEQVWFSIQPVDLDTFEDVS